MISMTTRAGSRPAASRLGGWRMAAGLTGTVAGAAIVAGAFLPWVETFAGLIGVPGVRGGNGRILAVMGVLIATAGLFHALRGGARSRWLAGIGGFAALGFSGYLLIQLAVTIRELGSDSMVLARGGPGLWVSASGSLLAFATLFLPAPAAGPGPGAPAWPSALRARAGRIGRAVLARTTDLDSRGARRGLQIALGLVWLLDAALQLQPSMFGPVLVSHVLMPPAMGNPAVIADPAMWATRLVSHDVVAWNTAFALIQLAIALGLLWRPTVKAALAGSLAWSLSVWWLGEGLGGLLTGTASPVTGAPGAVILYALLAVLIWPVRSGDPGHGTAAASPPGRHWSRAAWLVLWGSFAFLIMQPAIRAPGGLHSVIAGNAAGEPGWLAALDRSAAAAIGSHGTVISLALAALFILIASGILLPATVRPALVLAVVAGLAIWLFGENFGQIFTGRATDPNTGPLLVLLAVAYWPRPTVTTAQASAGDERRTARVPGESAHPARASLMRAASLLVAGGVADRRTAAIPRPR